MIMTTSTCAVGFVNVVERRRRRSRSGERGRKDKSGRRSVGCCCHGSPVRALDLETVNFDVLLWNSFFDQKSADLLSLITLKLDDLTEFFVFD